MRPRTATRVRRVAILAAASSITLAGTVAFAASSDASPHGSLDVHDGFSVVQPLFGAGANADDAYLGML